MERNERFHYLVRDSTSRFFVVKLLPNPWNRRCTFYACSLAPECLRLPLPDLLTGHRLKEDDRLSRQCLLENKPYRNEKLYTDVPTIS